MDFFNTDMTKAKVLLQHCDLIVITAGTREGVRNQECKMIINENAVDESGNITVVQKH